jgi:hypothetical protein
MGSTTDSYPQIPSPNLGPQIGNPDFPRRFRQPLVQNPGIISQIPHDYFLPFQFLFILPFYTLYLELLTVSLNKQQVNITEKRRLQYLIVEKYTNAL